jgi:hypothetical protein
VKLFNYVLVSVVLFVVALIPRESYAQTLRILPNCAEIPHTFPRPAIMVEFRGWSSGSHSWNTEIRGAEIQRLWSNAPGGTQTIEFGDILPVRLYESAFAPRGLPDSFQGPGRYRISIQVGNPVSQAPNILAGYSPTHHDPLSMFQSREVEIYLLAGPPPARPFESTYIDTFNELNTTIAFWYYPLGACDKVYCDSVMYVQVMHAWGEETDGTVDSLITFAEMLHPDSTWMDSLTTASGWVLDHKKVENDPYMNGNDIALIHEPTLDVGFPAEYWEQFGYTYDEPNVGDHSFPRWPSGAPRVWTFYVDYEVNAICVAGEGKGHWVGKGTWEWKRVKKTPRQVKPDMKFVGAYVGDCNFTGYKDEQPSANFLAALGLWMAKKGFALPDTIGSNQLFDPGGQKAKEPFPHWQ